MEERTKILIGEENQKKITNSNILIVGLGGVGGYTLENIVRAGVNNLTIVDGDYIDITNLNRQIIATRDTVGKSKVKAFINRIQSINPEIQLIGIKTILNEENIEAIVNKASEKKNLDYIIDAIDDLAAKKVLMHYAVKHDIPIISAMSAGFRLRPELLKISTIFKTNTCKIAKKLRKELKEDIKKDIEKEKNIEKYKKIKVVYSEEETIKPQISLQEQKNVIGSISFMPASMGVLMASVVINDLIA